MCDSDSSEPFMFAIRTILEGTQTLEAHIHSHNLNPSPPLTFDLLRVLSNDHPLQTHITQLAVAQSVLKGVVSKLNQQILAIGAREQDLRGLLVSIHILPPELLLVVFSFAYNGCEILARPAMARKLAAVCKSWRDIALRRPQLWDVISLAWSNEYRAIVLDRSAQRGVDVILPPTITPPVLQLPLAEKWLSLHVTCISISSSFEILRTLAPTLHNLPSLTINVEEPFEGTIPVHQMNIFPQLRALRFAHVVNLPHTIMWCPLTPQLRSIRYTIPISDRGLRRIFRECQNLEECVIETVYDDHGTPQDEQVPWGKTPLEAPSSLRILSFRAIRCRYFLHLAKWLRAPRLKELWIGTALNSIPAPECLGSASEEYTKFFSQLPTLEHLSIDCNVNLLHSILSSLHTGFTMLQRHGCGLPARQTGGGDTQTGSPLPKTKTFLPALVSFNMGASHLSKAGHHALLPPLHTASAQHVVDELGKMLESMPKPGRRRALEEIFVRGIRLTQQDIDRISLETVQLFLQ
ncbi:hypothetical protein DL93DRAFT_1894684 [Clavulina sp. PMI_390]|nr:hypothetical protein DL93DRAFT_1894684 [Clavulina sp. PMI_390]